MAADPDLMRYTIKYALAESFNDGVRAAMAVASERNEPAFAAAKRMKTLLKNPRHEAEGAQAAKEGAEIEARTMEADWLAEACAPWFAITSSEAA